ncbi:MAG: hypothetical protein JNK77_09735 [Saprospiraceae bacterium]|nr:hypothetical protein [Saprospiraceae bacterium]
MTVTEAFDGVADMLAKLDPAKIIELYASPEMSQRVEDLVNKKKVDDISLEEMLELERYLALDMLISLAKARARQLLAA